MQLIKINPFQAQAAQAAFAGGTQVFGLSIFNPLIRTWPIEASLSGDQQIHRIGMQRLSYDFFTHARTIGVRGVDEIDSQFDSAPQNPNGLRPIGGLAPNSISCDAHRAESKARNAKITSDQELARFFRGLLVSFICGRLIWHRLSFLTMRDRHYSLEDGNAGGVAKKVCPGQPFVLVCSLDYPPLSSGSLIP